ncbi:hypothetical protein Hanom_Chr07g00649221 [Helianthus anomalus]
MISNKGLLPDNQSKNAPDSTSNRPKKLRELTDSPVSVSQDSLLATETDIGEDSSNGFSSYKPNDDSSYGFSSSDCLELTKKHHKLDLGCCENDNISVLHTVISVYT